MYAHIGRQAIYNTDMVVAGYELLYRNGASGNTARIVDDDAATRGVLSDAVTVFGISHLTNNLPAYINFTRNLLMDDFAFLVDPVGIVVEVPGDIFVDNPLIDKLSELRRSGYKLALDSYTEFNGTLRFDPIIHMFDVVRVDISKGNRLQIKDLARRLRRCHAQLLAERIETEQDFDNAQDLGFTLFQGYFFEKPSMLSKEIPPLADSSYGRLLNELVRPNVNFERCCEIIQSDVVMSYLFLRQMQASSYYRGNLGAEILHGIVMMGTEELRRWVCLVLLKQCNVMPSDELSRKAFLRGRFIEQLMENSKTTLDPRQGFLLGMFSLLDQVMGVSLNNLLKNLNMEKALLDALLGRAENEYSMFLQYVVIYEMNNERLILPNIGLKLGEKETENLYMRCMMETDASFDGLSRITALYQGNLLR